MGDGTVFAILTGVSGPSYRDLGATMVIGPDGGWAGALTSGCIEADIILRAEDLRRDGRMRVLRYGAGSPYIDLRLPCGGAITVTLFLLRDAAVLEDLERMRLQRQPCALNLCPAGRLSLQPLVATGQTATGFSIGFAPPVRHVIFGAGPEALVFAGLVAALEQDHLLLSHDDATLAAAPGHGCRAERLGRLFDAKWAAIDAMTAVTLFYHDHDHEAEILRTVLQSPAFYIGAQGSRAAQEKRRIRLAELGVPETALARLRGPIGLIRSSRNARDLAISALAEITEAAGRQAGWPAAVAG
ncbi:MAG: XdhC family protein [Rhodobacteraceae bacterium]|jgi:xanthine dehydrogenase accessory factor|nr:XdhC family protein [Paracoccaceae bacterium]